MSRRRTVRQIDCPDAAKIRNIQNTAMAKRKPRQTEARPKKGVRKKGNPKYRQFAVLPKPSPVNKGKTKQREEKEEEGKTVGFTERGRGGARSGKEPAQPN